jgi:hypothetical protein
MLSLVVLQIWQLVAQPFVSSGLPMYSCLLISAHFLHGDDVVTPTVADFAGFIDEELCRYK